MLSIFEDSQEYTERTKIPFRPTKVTLAEIRAAVPKHLHERSTVYAIYYSIRDVLFAYAVYKLGWTIDPFTLGLVEKYGISSATFSAIKWSLWSVYWFSESICLAGWWCLAHEAGHGTLSDYNWVNHAIGFSLHTFLLVPYYAWRSTHRAHHKAAASIERDENYVPRTRSDYKLPPQSVARLANYHEIFEEAPFYTLCRMLLMQLIGWQFYLLRNVMGSPRYPPGTNHFQPSSALFKTHERIPIIACNIALIVMLSVIIWWTRQAGFAYFVKLYLVPYIVTNHWIVMLTYLQHSDPTIPHYRNSQWSFVRGATSTIDRPLLGFLGRFFLHNISHDHVAHHLFSSTPFYNQPAVTEVLKEVLKDEYYNDNTNTFRALYRTFTQCVFIENDDEIAFYKNRDGEAARELAPDALEYAPKKMD
ncbi:delta-12 fatty acid desaturase [Pholiota conissans]|uniref:Delta-12 fatty acid desaturase n=1 Tax=Pholiota conissans TaxID=109636 RepID=A0A9P5YY42_9AGAR|nr:delta-12 fatty acid desaturase [Pholiota conissans]